MDASQFYRLFRQACQTYQLYPSESPVRLEATARLLHSLGEVTQTEGLSIVFLEEGAFVDGQAVPGGVEETGPPLWRRIFELGVGELRFLPGVTATELGRLLDLLARAQQGLLNPVDEDLSVLLWESELAHISYWLYEDDSWLEEDLVQTGAGIGDEFRGLLEAAERDEQAMAEHRLFLSAADAVLNIDSGEDGHARSSEERSVPYRGLPLGEYLDEELTITSELPGGVFAHLSEVERLRIVSAFRQENAEVVPWKYGRLLVEVLRLETEPDESGRIEQLLEQYFDVLLEAERFDLLRSLASSLQPRREGAIVPPAVARAEAHLLSPAFMRKVGEYVLSARGDNQSTRDREAAVALLSRAGLDLLIELTLRSGTEADTPCALQLRARITSDLSSLLACFEHEERSIRWFAIDCAADAGTEAMRRLREMARDGDVETRCRAIHALRGSTESATLAVLSGALHDAEPVVRIAAAEGLAGQGGTRALEPLLRVLVGKDFERRDPSERRLFFVAAGRSAPREVLPVLARLAEQRGLFHRGEQAGKAECALLALADLAAEAAPYLRERWGMKHRELWRQFEQRVAAKGEPARLRRAA